jgi:hypothetical protein
MRRVLLTTLALIVFASASLAQSNTGRLVGTVSDSSGVIPGATVVVTDNKTGKERTVVASDDGTFTVPQLDPGTYTVKITAQGHKTFMATEVKIDVGRDYSLNPTMDVGEISESITVTAGADVVNSTNAELSTTVSPRQIQELPLNGRDPTSLVGLQAGTASNGANNTSINGQRPTFTNITRDGINIQDNHIRGNASDFSVERPSVDDVQEFTFTSQNASADRGYGASQVQFVTPRGQNEFHGAIFEYNRNSKFSANSFFNNSSGTQKAFLNRNQYGFKLSGPAIKDKVFFFGFYEGFRLRNQTSNLRTILTPTARQGIFTYIDNAGTTRSVNVFTLLNNPTIPGINPVIQSRILANVPTTGNTADVGDQRNTTGYRFLQRNNTDRDKYTTRIDYDINSRNSLNVVFTYTDERLVDRGDVDRSAANGGGGGFGTTPVFDQPSNRIFSSTAYRWTPTANFTNEFRFGFFFSDPIFERRTPLPAFTLSSAASLGTLPLINNPEINFEPQGRDTRNYTGAYNGDYQWGNHAFRFGGQLQVVTDNTFAAFDVVPRYQLGTSVNTPALAAAQFAGGISNAQLNTANALLALLGGVVSGVTQNFNPSTPDSGFVAGQPAAFRYRFDDYSFYFADQWRIHPKLTMNLGLRYELITPLRELNGLAVEPVIPAGQTVEQAVLNPIGTIDLINGFGNNKLNRTDKNNFAPVLGIAWAPTFRNNLLNTIFPGEGRTIIRGGYKVSYVNDEILRSQDSSQQTNVGLSTTVTNNSLNQRLGETLATIPTPAFRFPRTFLENNLISNFFAPIFAIDPNYQIARSNEYNFGIQREIGFDTVLEVRYVGAYSKNLPRGLDINNFDMTNNGFLQDFIRARNNLQRFGAAGCTAAQAASTGCQQLTVFPNFVGGGLLTNPAVTPVIRAGEPQALLLLYVQNGLQGTVPLRVNENAGTVSILTNGGHYNYNGLQVEFRRRFSKGLYFQANYTFQKTLTDASGTDQFKFNTNLDNSRPELEYSRANYDQTHVFNFNGIYELPFGKGKRWFNSGEWTNRILGGWQFASIVNVATGAPYTFVDVRGTLNRASRSASQTPQTALSTGQIKDLVGIFRTPCGVFFINPSVINLNMQTCTGTGRASEGLDTTPFAGQVFFNNGPGQTGSLERNFVNGPLYFNIDASLIKNIQLTENVRFQLRAEFFNLLNHTNFFAGVAQNGAGSIFDINSQNFGRVTQTLGTPRIIQFAGRIEF